MKKPRAGNAGRQATREEYSTSAGTSTLQRAAPPHSTITSPDLEEGEAAALASRDACPRPCRIPFHRLRLTVDATEDEINAIIDQDLGTDCRLCGQHVHMSEWVRIYREDTGQRVEDLT